MNYMRTAILLAGLTGLFMAVGYLIGGGSGALIALIIAAATKRQSELSRIPHINASVHATPSRCVAKPWRAFPARRSRRDAGELHERLRGLRLASLIR